MRNLFRLPPPYLILFTLTNYTTHLRGELIWTPFLWPTGGEEDPKIGKFSKEKQLPYVDLLK